MVTPQRSHLFHCDSSKTMTSLLWQHKGQAFFTVAAQRPCLLHCDSTHRPHLHQFDSTQATPPSLLQAQRLCLLPLVPKESKVLASFTVTAHRPHLLLCDRHKGHAYFTVTGKKATPPSLWQHKGHASFTVTGTKTMPPSVWQNKGHTSFSVTAHRPRLPQCDRTKVTPLLLEPLLNHLNLFI